LQADGALRYVQPVSGAREAELFGDGYKIMKLASIKRDSAAGDGFENTGMTYSINAQQLVYCAAPHIFGDLQRIRISCNACWMSFGQLANQVVIPKISVDHRAFSGYCIVHDGTATKLRGKD
jgi:hypothetical protein